MVQTYFSSRSSSETDTEVDTPSEYESEFEYESAAGLLTPSESVESFELLRSISSLSISSQLENAVRSGSNSPDYLLSGAATPKIATPRAQTPVPDSEIDKLRNKLIAQLRLASSPEELRSAVSQFSQESEPVEWRGTHSSCKNAVESNLSNIQADPRGWGLKFIAMCVSCAFGGRIGLSRYSSSLGSLNITSIQSQLKGCTNPRGQLNASCMCYVGHIVLYYFAVDANVKRALLARFGEGLARVVGSKENVVKELGREHLWAEKVSTVNTWKKAQVIRDVKGRFPKNEELFKEVLGLLGVQA